MYYHAPNMANLFQPRVANINNLEITSLVGKTINFVSKTFNFPLFVLLENPPEIARTMCRVSCWRLQLRSPAWAGACYGARDLKCWRSRGKAGAGAVGCGGKAWKKLEMETSG